MKPRLSLPLLLLLAGLSCSKNVTQAGGLELLLMSDLPASYLNKVHLEISQETAPGVWHKHFDYAPLVPQEVSLPTTASIAAGDSPNQGALIIFTGQKESQVEGRTVVHEVVQRVVQTQVPTDRVAELKILLTVPCVDKVTACAVGESCQPNSGVCGSNIVDSSTLPTYVAPQVPETLTGGMSAGCTPSCPTGQVCERGMASCADPAWAAWPVPNSQVDVAAGARNLESYTDNGDRTVTDNVTGLMWQQATAGPSTQPDAIAYCEGLGLGGYSDWRLPTKIELLSIVDYGQQNPAVDRTAFPDTQSKDYWSSTTPAGVQPDVGAWYVGFAEGLTDWEFPGGPMQPTFVGDYSRCVR